MVSFISFKSKSVRGRDNTLKANFLLSFIYSSFPGGQCSWLLQQYKHIGMFVCSGQQKPACLTGRHEGMTAEELVGPVLGSQRVYILQHTGAVSSGDKGQTKGLYTPGHE